MDIRWRPQLYLSVGRSEGVPEDVLNNAVGTAKRALQSIPPVPPILTLKHLSQLTNVGYGVLRAAVGRRLTDDYAVFRVKKLPRGTRQEFRVICVPCEPLLHVQRWLARNVLRQQPVHDASCAYAPNSQLVDACQIHCNAQWLIKTDIRRFFESTSEIMIFRAFRVMGYEPLVAFELARLTTRVSKTRHRPEYRWYGASDNYPVIAAYQNETMGHLPQGAPTSPMLSNLVAKTLDEQVADIASHYGLRYTRYADDLTLSSTDKRFGRRRASKVIQQVYAAMRTSGFSPNICKTQVIPPGARKVVLGLLVDSARPRLSRRFRDALRQHVYYVTHPQVGPVQHAARRGFTSLMGLRNHIFGLIAFAHAVDPSYSETLYARLASVQWPM